MQTFDQFIQTWSGEQPLYKWNPEENRGQCYQLFNFYNRDVVGAPDFLAPYAYQIFTEFEGSPLEPFYDKIEYTSGATPERGDAVIWGNLPGTELYINGRKIYAGHVSHCTIPGVIIFEAFGCNWGGKQAHLVEHDFSYVLGWLRPKKGVRMLTKEQIITIHKLIFTNREPGPGLVEGWAGKPLDEFLQAMMKDKTWTGWVDRVAKLEQDEGKLQEVSKALAVYQAAAGDVEATAIGKALIKLFQTFGYRKG